MHTRRPGDQGAKSETFQANRTQGGESQLRRKILSCGDLLTKLCAKVAGAAPASFEHRINSELQQERFSGTTSTPRSAPDPAPSPSRIHYSN